MAEKRRGLGRGLGALIPNAEMGEETPQEAKKTSTTSGRSSQSKQKTATEKPAEVAKKSARTSKSSVSKKSTQQANVSRETLPIEVAQEDKAQAKTTTGGTRKKRADMGAALRNTTAARRPADFFFGGAEAEEDKLLPVPGAEFTVLNVKDIHPNRKQPRTDFDEQDMEELVHSIKEIGVLQPIVVRPTRESGEEKYELVMGERRWRATQRAGLDTIPAIVRETQDVDLLRDALLENLHRSQLNPIEEAAAYQQLLEEFGTTQEQLAQKIGRSRPQISNTIRLLKLPALVQRRVAAGVLSSGHARALLGVRSQAEVEKLAQKIVNEGLSVRAVEELVAASGETNKKERKAPQAQKHHERLDYIADAFADKLDTNVKIQLGARKGKMTIEFASVEDLNRIISVLDPEMKK